MSPQINEMLGAKKPAQKSRLENRLDSVYLSIARLMQIAAPPQVIPRPIIIMTIAPVVIIMLPYDCLS